MLSMIGKRPIENYDNCNTGVMVNEQIDRESWLCGDCLGNTGDNSMWEKHRGQFYVLLGNTGDNSMCYCPLCELNA